MEPKVVVRKFLDFLEAVMAKQDRDDSYNKLKLQEVTATLDLMSRPTVNSKTCSITSLLFNQQICLSIGHEICARICCF